MSLLTFKANKVVRHILYYCTSFCQFQLPIQTNRKHQKQMQSTVLSDSPLFGSSKTPYFTKTPQFYSNLHFCFHSKDQTSHTI